MNRYVRYALVPSFSMALVIAAVAPAYAQEQEPQPVETIEAASDPIATFSNITDAAPGICFDAEATKKNAANSTNNELAIAVHSGLNPLNWSNTACIASTAAFHARQMSDTIAVRVEAPDGHYISALEFTSSGNATSYRLAQVFAGAQWVVDGFPAMASIDGASVNLDGLCKSAVNVSFSIFLGAKIVGTPGTATASVTNPMLKVVLAPKGEGCQ